VLLNLNSRQGSFFVQKECVNTAPILDQSGIPNYFGWSRSPAFLLANALLQLPQRRITSSDRFIIFSSNHMLVAEVLDGGYLGYVGITVIFLKTKKRTTKYFVVPFPMGSFNMPQNSESGSVKLQEKKITIDFSAVDGGCRFIKIDFPGFSRSKGGLRGYIVLTPPENAESLYNCMPWREDKQAFRITRRSPWFIAEGAVQFGTSELQFTKDDAWGIFDWNRGVRPKNDVRYWAAACGLCDGKKLAFTVGYGSADGSQGTENGFFLDGKLHKLDQVTFHINPESWLGEWRFTSNDQRLDMTFTPIMERTGRHRLFFHSMKRRQVFGHFSGKIILDDNNEIEFKDILGFAERKRTRF
jgi:hypothetical protein